MRVERSRCDVSSTRKPDRSLVHRPGTVREGEDMADREGSSRRQVEMGGPEKGDRTRKDSLLGVCVEGVALRLSSAARSRAADHNHRESLMARRRSVDEVGRVEAES
jgi:hypothetical protein